ncbi:MAG: ImmA/IrrE family metallo-endopeptidase [Phascolarctobacterium sp.]
MTGSYRAKPLSRNNIRAFVKTIKQVFGVEKDFMFPVVEFLEKCLPVIFEDFSLEVLPVEEMPYKEGETYPSEHRIIIREDVYEKACAGDGRARFTIAHEIGHLFYHTNEAISLCRMKGKIQLKAYENPEWQANVFAGELLASSYLIKGLTASEVKERCGVSITAARVQLDAANK